MSAHARKVDIYLRNEQVLLELVHYFETKPNASEYSDFIKVLNFYLSGVTRFLDKESKKYVKKI